MPKPGKGMTLLDFLHANRESAAESTCATTTAGKADPEPVAVATEPEERTRVAPRIYSVYEVTSRIKRILDSDVELRDLYVKGELSNLSQPTSGHLYFTLKDELSELPCVMFREQSRGLLFAPEDGMSVIVRGHLSVYEKRGKYQLYVDEIQAAGLGALYLAFEQLKKRLKAEGLFDARYKKPIPCFPHRIGLITSPTGAAIRDILKITKKRYPHVRLLLAPVAVQGEGASLQIVRAIRAMNRYSVERESIDVLIVGRGGGSLEELWAFNEESVARAIFASEIPVISAVGHETDFTIADFVAAKRAATPSEAAELVVPDMREVEKNLRTLELRLRQNVFQAIETYRKRLTSIEQNILFRKPSERINQYRQTVDELKRTLEKELTYRIALQRKHLQALIGKLDALSPLAILDRGYSICSRLTDGRIVRSVHDIAVGDALMVLLRDGEAVSEVKEKRAKQQPR
jgi:exodeoxyribonuclease VII large subunit